ncbi:MAG: hypothetical protein ISN29_05040 [Gammaproteobacteria bacterium AqS3]|nr:hypothetical protein [Gammaproteobacteria bacterium AqS3]
MTVCVAVKWENLIAIAADQFVDFSNKSYTSSNLAINKIKGRGNVRIASCGYAIYAQMMEKYLAKSNSDPVFRNADDVFEFFYAFTRDTKTRYHLNGKTNDGPFSTLGNEFLVVSPTGIYGVSTDLCVHSFDKFHAIGAGEEVAIGAAFALRETLEKTGKISVDDHAVHSAEYIATFAVKAAAFHNKQCGFGIDSDTIAYTGPRPQ